MHPDLTIPTKNRIDIVDDGSAVVHLTQGQVTTIDVADIPLVAPYRWCALRVGTGFYAVTHVADSNGKRPLMYMHRLLMHPPKGLDVDHEDRDGLNNRRANLRSASRSQNLANKGLQSNNSSGYKGVRTDSRRSGWIASIKFNRRRVHIGTFPTAEAAAHAYDAKARELHGEFAYLNFPDS